MLRLAAAFFLVATGSAAAQERPASQRFADPATAPEPSFRRHVIPLISRIGCNGRACHGSFAGQGGFQLSLFGYDFAKDHHEITADAEYEVRVDKDEPERSLLLLKPTMQEKHKGEKRIDKGSWEYTLLLRWIRNGAVNDADKTGELQRLEVSPAEIVFDAPGRKQTLRVIARWADGTVEDVTELTRFQTNDESVAKVAYPGVVTATGKGDTHVVAFYDNDVVPVPVVVPVSDRIGARFPNVPTPTPIDAAIVAKLRKLGIVPSEKCTDAEFLRRVSLDLAGTLPTPDQVTAFLSDKSPGKRAAKVEELLATPAYAAWWTTRLCDYTGNNPAALNNGGIRSMAGTLSRQWYDWIYRRVAENVPYDTIVEGIVLATGRTKPDQTYEEFAAEMASYFKTSDAADFAERPNMPHFWERRNVRKPEEMALAFAHSFLGVRIECAQCHKHPFDQWTNDDFKQFQAFFEPIRFGGRPEKGELSYDAIMKALRAKFSDKKDARKELEAEFQRMVDAGETLPWQEVYIDQRAGKLDAREIERRKRKDPNFSGRVLTPRILGGEEVLLSAYPDPRAPLMQWLRDKGNPYFAASLVNRVWANYFGRGIVDPPDDMNLANPPANRALLDLLTRGFIDAKYDLKWLHRQIIASDAYQRSWRSNETNRLDERNFSRMVPRRMPAEVVADALVQATASKASLARWPGAVEERAIGPNAGGDGRGEGKRAATGLLAVLRLFGRPTRETNCDCERSEEPTLLQTLFTRNDPELMQLIETGRNGAPSWIAELRGVSPAKGKGKRPAPATKRETPDADALVTEIFLRTVSRPPTDEERQKAREDLAAAADPIDGARDLLWVMLNTREFMVNH
jgi:hypothetical protein